MFPGAPGDNDNSGIGTGTVVGDFFTSGSDRIVGCGTKVCVGNSSGRLFSSFRGSRVGVGPPDNSLVGEGSASLSKP